jgi:type I protein arginine methyltransferase
MSEPIPRAPRQRAQDAAFGAIDKLREVASRSERARRIAYAIKNRNTFADLRQHDRMLADRVRVDSYWEGLQKHVRSGDVVVDLGTGTGVLAIFAARAGAGEVHAIEHGPMAEVAQEIARDNGADAVKVHRVHSRSFELPGGVDVIVHEQIGEALFEERVVENVADLRDRVLKPGGKILPAKLELHVEPVQLTEEARLPFAHEQELHGVRFGALKPYADRQPFGYRYAWWRPVPLERHLSTEAERAPVVAVDLHTVNPGDLPQRIELRRTAAADGILDGFAVSFRAGFDDELWFSSAPDQPPTSWGNPFLRVERQTVRAGDTIALTIEASNLATPSTWTWSLDVTPAA